mmetsp:Transcript_54205/g.158260  ORF Transcript_54205/g.158260 Transcript_54205/m.158260 type:complete len:252 (+) Transcript_54205:2300-3055(+)
MPHRQAVGLLGREERLLLVAEERLLPGIRVQVVDLSRQLVAGLVQVLLHLRLAPVVQEVLVLVPLLLLSDFVLPACRHVVLLQQPADLLAGLVDGPQCVSHGRLENRKALVEALHGLQQAHEIELAHVARQEHATVDELVQVDRLFRTIDHVYLSEDHVDFILGDASILKVTCEANFPSRLPGEIVTEFRHLAGEGVLSFILILDDIFFESFGLEGSWAVSPVLRQRHAAAHIQIALRLHVQGPLVGGPFQ